jgi:hypothetical protein
MSFNSANKARARIITDLRHVPWKGWRDCDGDLHVYRGGMRNGHAHKGTVGAWLVSMFSQSTVERRRDQWEIHKVFEWGSIDEINDIVEHKLHTVQY